jgi:hypothetical protein
MPILFHYRDNAAERGSIDWMLYFNVKFNCYEPINWIWIQSVDYRFLMSIEIGKTTGKELRARAYTFNSNTAFWFSNAYNPDKQIFDCNTPPRHSNLWLVDELHESNRTRSKNFRARILQNRVELRPRLGQSGFRNCSSTTKSSHFLFLAKLLNSELCQKRHTHKLKPHQALLYRHGAPERDLVSDLFVLWRAIVGFKRMSCMQDF